MAVSSVTSASTDLAAQTSAAPGDASDRFLKLLVAQMQNQDPLNPMDNAQVTSQMAQINTVNGIEKLNTTVEGLNTQFVQMQALQGASLVGHDVVLQGDRLAIEDGVGQGGYDLSMAADRVKLEVLGPAGQPIATVDLGAKSAGRQRFEWPAGTHADGENLRFRITATSGAATVSTTPLMTDQVLAVSNAGDSLSLELARSGTVAYSAVKAVR